jgi:hypothetical protein
MSSNYAQRFFAAPNQRVPNNPLNANSLLAPQSNHYENLYRDGSFANLPGTSAPLAVLPPEDPRARLAQVQPYAQTEPLADLSQAGRLGLGTPPGPLSSGPAAAPNEWVQSPGIAATVPRYPSGHPGQMPLAAGPLPPAGAMGSADLIGPQKTVIGRPADSRFPRRPRAN